MRVSRRNAAAFEARNISSLPIPTTSGTWWRAPTRQARVVVMDHDEREVALELVERETHGLDEVALVVALDEMRDRLRVGLGRERVAVGRRGSRSARGSSRRCRSGRSRASRARQPASGCAFASVTPPCVAQRVWPSPVVAVEPFARRAPSDCRADRPRARSRDRQPRGARCPRSRSRGTPGARGPGGGAACTHATRRIR